MCGITGKFYFSGNERVSHEEIHQMNERVKHRGPDDEGIFISTQGNIGLGHRRLSIIDITSAGHQPMSNEDGSVWIVFNGELYNFQELRLELEKKGHKFRSQTDTETILHLYEDYGEDCLKRLAGMFAFALWDEKKQKLFLARDRVGKKPLKYFIGRDFIVFASELKAFLNDVQPLEIDFEAIHHYLVLQYVPCPMTGFNKIQKLAPGHYLTVDVSNNKPKIKIQRYWALDYSKKLNLKEEEWQELIFQELERAVKSRLVADVPLGVFLSGGLDSSVIAALMAKNSKERVRTFSIGFEEEKYNELPYARLIAKKFNTIHQEFIVKPDALQILPDLIWHYEEPYADSSAIPLWYLSQLTRKTVTVALNGDGGDENFAGYGMFPVHLFAHNVYRYLPEFLRKNVSIPATFFLNKIFQTTFTERFYRFAYSFEKGKDLRYLYYISYFTPLQREKIYSDGFKKRTDLFRRTEDLFLQICDSSQVKDIIDRVLYFNFSSYLPDDLLVKVDIATMAFGLEARSPLLDHKFLELTAKIPSNLKIKNFKTKYIFKKTFENILPPEVVFRKKKGFGVPLEYWFRGSMKSYIKAVLLDKGARTHQFIKKEEIEKLIIQHLKTKINYSAKIWALLTLELWLQQFYRKQK